ncbi:MAG: hypothetical protein KME55_38855 [Nostoc indistinguendum CM1-VF10]|jgi:alkylresorcinol/alkylpyrone synthase|nr:hypothetical protein [Nostoc indistinguendum CM1-VF10]
MTYIVATSTGFPSHYYPQEVLATALHKYCLEMELVGFRFRADRPILL